MASTVVAWSFALAGSFDFAELVASIVLLGLAKNVLDEVLLLDVVLEPIKLPCLRR